MNLFIIDGALRRLGRSTDFEPSLGALGTRVPVGVLRPLGVLGVLGILGALVDPFLVVMPRRPGVRHALAKLEALCDVGKEGEDFLEVLDLRLSPVGELFPRS